MRPARQAAIDREMERIKGAFGNNIASRCEDSEELIYSTCSLMIDFLRMNYAAINGNVPQQEAKAAFKIALDSVLIDYGLSTVIHEFQ